jgi:predicted protein tyrosine phosphatase
VKADRQTPELRVLSRKAIEAYVPDQLEACISITDPGSPPAAISSQFQAVLRLSFHDVTSRRLTRSSDILFDDTHVKAILDFVRDWDRADRLIIHCEMGQSRSAGIARALTRLRGESPAELEQRFPGWNRLICSRLVAGGGQTDQEEDR